ncbi:MAG: SRPBCC domain-containing protein [Aggregatilineales bacterium]
MTAPETTTQRIEITRTMTAPATKVYTALTQRNYVVMWFSDDAHLTARVDAPIQLTWNTGFHVQGVFTALEANQQVSYTWRDNLSDNTTQVDMHLTGKDALTELSLVHSGAMSGEVRQQYEAEWQRVLDNLVSFIEDGADLRIVNRVIIGIFPGGVPQEIQDELGLVQGDAVQVTSVLEGMGAANAGLQTGDIILAMDGTAVTRQTPMFMLVQDKMPGDDVEVSYYREGKKHSATMTLSGYPIPDVPENFAALGDLYHSQVKQVYTDLAALFDGSDETQAAAYPAENEWSANQVLAHLILSSRDHQGWLSGHISGFHKRTFNSNVHAWVDSIVETYQTSEGLLAALKTTIKETVAIMKNRPTTDFEAANLWWATFQSDGNLRHLQSHFPQIVDALAAAKR